MYNITINDYIAEMFLYLILTNFNKNIVCGLDHSGSQPFSYPFVHV